MMNIDFPSLTAAIPEWMARETVHGLCVCVVVDGEIAWNQGFGVLCTDTNEPVTSTSVFEAASLSKQVFAYAVLKLCEVELLELDRPLREYLDHDYVEDERVSAITTRHVLSHMSGFPNHRGKDVLCTHFTPGRQFSYSGEGFFYLQHVVDALVDEPVHAYIAREVMTPLEMQGAAFVWTGNDDQPVAHPHDAEGKAKPKATLPEMNAAYSLHCSALDYTRFLRFVLTQPRDHPLRLSDDLHRAMFTPQVPVNDSIDWHDDWPRKTPQLHDTIHWGLGWGIHCDDDKLAVWQWGSNPCTRSFVIGFPESRTGALFMGNCGNAERLWSELTQALFGEPFPPVEWVEKSYGA